jgi:TATA-box binding protein (TBP) (component of TFIID and TFIIIB)
MFGKNKTIKVHRAVAETFLGESEQEVNHIDLNKSNNSLTNLEYCTRGHNVRHMHFGNRRFVHMKKKNNRFYIEVAYGGKVIIRGGKSFDTEEEAYQTVHKLYTEHFGFEPWSNK